LHHLGVLWQILNPAIQIFIYWLVFGLGIRGGKPIGDIPYLIWLLCGLIPWFFINPSLIQGSNSIFTKINLVSKMKFPVSILPTLTIVSNSVNFFVMFVILLIIIFINGITPNIYFLQLPYYFLCLFLFLFSFTLLFSTFSAIIRDFQSMLQTVMKMLFYLTPILWDTNKLPETIQDLLKLNPIFYLIEGFRNTLLFKTWFFEDLGYTMYFWTINLLIIFLGSLIHIKYRKKFIDYL
jgi:teichoic acid transport system permease protein